MERNWILGVVLSVAGLITLVLVDEPGERVAAFITVAAGWGVILWRMEAVSRSKMRALEEAQAGLVDLSREFHKVLDEFTDTFADQFTKGRRELRQLRSLLRDAVERLSHAFSFLAEQIEAQQELLEEVAGHSGSLMRHGSVLANVDAGAWHGHDDVASAGVAHQTQALVEEVVTMSDRLAVGVAQLWRVKGEVDTTLGEAIMALQFEDITAQLADHVVDRVAYLETLLCGIMKIEEDMAADRLDADGARSVYQCRVRKMREALQAASALVEQAEHVAVHQETLTAGEVELF